MKRKGQNEKVAQNDGKEREAEKMKARVRKGATGNNERGRQRLAGSERSERVRNTKRKRERQREFLVFVSLH